MIDGDVFRITVPRLTTTNNLDEPIVADGCETNTNYYSDTGSRGTCCCGCDKPSV